jgi:plastocyanin
MFRRTCTLVAAALLTVTFAACGSDDQEETATPAEATQEEASAGGATVDIKTFTFDPDPLEVDAGTTITFTNGDKINHSVTAGTREAPEPEEFDGVMEAQGDTFELTLDEPGTYAYFCKFHPGEGMTAEIVVR